MFLDVVVYLLPLLFIFGVELRDSAFQITDGRDIIFADDGQLCGQPVHIEVVIHRVFRGDNTFARYFI